MAPDGHTHGAIGQAQGACARARSGRRMCAPTIRQAHVRARDQAGACARTRSDRRMCTHVMRQENALAICIPYMISCHRDRSILRSLCKLPTEVHQNDRKNVALIYPQPPDRSVATFYFNYEYTYMLTNLADSCSHFLKYRIT